ncbi:N,N-dimethylformamidase large subunit [Tropicibacter sp. R16_0]|uniref:N,N-dimethylformamidase beta subunit family domain-containing protein n=1 Tax=Tropicibacter sp. R16_0 TaxID=2821102 RepID=UPI001ADA2D20|nr:N,N-dimethylformamidase beta subunit family domain-containing protein [Tropicibacter sp. R16_0]MBO9453136.1 N,N-dimethylformamidase large subunit [Tropicibacter sp. R16_0]
MRAPNQPESVTPQDLARVLPITGYLDRLSGRPGQKIAVKVSAQGGGQYEADVVRIVSGDPNPSGPGLIYERQDFGSGTYDARSQSIDRGSYAVVPTDPVFSAPALWFSAHVQPWLLRDTPSTIAAATGPDGSGWRLEMSASELRFCHIDDQGRVETVDLKHGITPKNWVRAWAGFDHSAGRVELGYSAVVGDLEGRTERQAPLGDFGGPLRLSFAARLDDDVSHAHFNGRIEAPKLHFASPMASDGQSAGKLAASWDFSQGINTSSIVDCGPHGLAGRLVNLPTRAVRGVHWDGTAMDWQVAPEHYAAIHFHEDDLSDCRWDTDFEVHLPDDVRSGVYGVRLTSQDGSDVLPFYVLPALGAPKAPICVLASTLTHLAYANHARGNTDTAFRARMNDWGAAANADDYPIYGRSTYNFHPDGSGISLSSRLRPVLSMRPGYLTFDDPRGSGLRHFPADTHLTYWLEQKQLEFDIVTDEDLDDEGAQLLDGYQTVVTGSHPEYHTPRMLDALQTYRDTGGKLVYLGGNGFYWRIARRPEQPGVIEIRRTEGGIRAWAADTGEAYHQLDGGYGGLWRRNGRPPQALVGVGFSAQGVFDGSYYLRTKASFDKEYSWIFDGVSEERLGDYGYSGGGAAGFELDRSDTALGTPENTVILAVSTKHGDSFVPVPEELLSHLHTVTGEPPKDLIRSEMIYSRLKGGGALFSVGSITFCGSLLSNACENGVSKVLENVLRRFTSGDQGLK